MTNIKTALKKVRDTLHCPDCGRTVLQCKALAVWSADQGRLMIADTYPLSHDTQTDWLCTDCGWEGNNPVEMRWPIGGEPS